MTMLGGILLPAGISEVERDHLARLNRLVMLLFVAHVPVLGFIGFVNDTGALQAILLGALACIGPVLAFAALGNPRHVTLIHAITVAIMGGILTHVGRGPMQIEMHFYFFVCLALLSTFANPMAIIVAAASVALHHAVMWLLFPASVFNYTASWVSLVVHSLFLVMASVPTCIIARVFFERVIGGCQLARDHAAELRRVHGLLAGARRISVELAREARVLSASAEAISEAAVIEAASVEQSAATLGGLALAARSTSEYTVRANELAVSSCALAESGAEVVRLTRTEMATLRDASTRVADIAGTMDEISFQTNLLALNAAVEAARAGDHGRGFAVVAQEVRNLAVRSTTAAREIRALIHGSLQQVTRCVELVDRSDETLARVAASASEVETLMNGIAQAIHDESVNISDLSRAASGTTDTVQRTATQAVELTNTVARLSAMADELGELIAMTPQPRTPEASATPAQAAAVDRAPNALPSRTASRPVYAGVDPNAKSPPNNRPSRVHFRSRV